jgi:hypothetical protein
MLEAFDLTGSLRDAAELAACSHHADPASPPRQTTVLRTANKMALIRSLVRERARVRCSNRLADVAGNPAGRVEAHGLRARQRREVILDSLKFGGTDLLCPLIA